MRLGLISDTHGLLRPEVFAAFEGVDHILHAGDVEDPDILLALGTIAPTTAVWGNVDDFELRRRLPEVATLEVGGMRVVVVHGHQFGSPSPSVVAATYPEVDMVVFGHSHAPIIEKVGGLLAVNPGSAGPARFSRPVTVALVTVADGQISASLKNLVSRGRRE
jgi:putative phosphoesterase